MTNDQIEKASWDFSDSQRLSTEDDRATAYAKAFKAGAHFALASQWISVGERLPENTDYVLAHVPQRILPAYCEVAYWDNEDWRTQDGELIRPDFWLPIPQLNPEKDER